MGAIIWLASYPKSGNTWLRAFLHNLLRNPQEGYDINRLDDFTLSESAYGWYHMIDPRPVEAYSTAEVAAMRPQVHRRLTTVFPDSLFVKTHCAVMEDHGVPTVTVEVTAGSSHTVALGGVAANCTLAGGPSKSGSVTAGGTTTIAFAVTCATIEINATGKIAFESNRAGNFDVWVMNADGTGVQQLTTHTAYDFEDEGVLAVGDALVTSHGTSKLLGPQLLPTVFHHDLARARASLEQLLASRSQVALPGHGEAWIGPVDAAVDAALRAGTAW